MKPMKIKGQDIIFQSPYIIICFFDTFYIVVAFCVVNHICTTCVYEPNLSKYISGVGKSIEQYNSYVLVCVFLC